jgi:tRNA (cmo5U34)-methyltransferase
VLAEGRWTFDAEVTDAFDDMLARSIPQYDVMRQTVFDVGRNFLFAHSDVIDLGCSRGQALARFVDYSLQTHLRNHFIGIDVSEPMLAASRERFKEQIEKGVVDIRYHDLRKGYPDVRTSLTLCVLTLQFTPIEYRQRILRSIYLHTQPGGALILVEKLLGASAELDDLMVNNYLLMKALNGYTLEQIDRKRLSLEGVLVPLTAQFNETLLANAGFREVDCFWRWMNFGAWVAVRER